MRSLLATTLVCFSLSVSLTISLTGEAAAGSFDGWCFPANECTGEPMPISGNTFNTCEASCVMKQPTNVNNMTGTLYNVVCTSDASGSQTARMFFLRYTTPNSAAGALAISNFGAVELEKCQ